MPADTPILIQGAVEGPVDEAVLRRLIREAGADVGAIYGNKGKQYLLKQLEGFNQAAMHSPWVVLVDLDQDADCAPLFHAMHLPTPSARMCFRVIVREVEAWLLADREGLGRFLGVSLVRISRTPESLLDPKQELVNLARRSRKREIREDMVPRPSSGRLVGAAYTSRLIEFAQNQWQPADAAIRADSLGRFLIRLQDLVSHGF